MNYGQADLLQSRPEKDKPALVMRIDMGNPYNDRRHRVMWAELQNQDEPIIGALEMDAACVVVNLFMLPDEPDLFRQCVANIAATRAACSKYGMPLMIEPLVMLPNEVRGGYQVDGDAEKIVPLVRLAAEMGADIIKADPTSEPRGFPPRHRGGARAGAGARRRQGGPPRPCSGSRRRCWRRARMGLVYGRNIYQHENPKRVVAALMAMIHQRRLRRRGMGDLPAMAERRACSSASTPATPSSRRCCSTAPATSWRRASATAPRLRRRPAMSSATWRSSGPTPPR